MRLLSASKRILRALQICPWVPIDVLVPLVAARRRVTVYQALARLRTAGLVETQRVRLGPLVGAQPLGLWAVTEQGREALRASDASSLYADQAATASLPLEPHGRRSRTFLNSPLRVAAARGLAAMLVAESAHGLTKEVVAWEAPWVWVSTKGDRSVVRLPAAALVNSVRASGVGSTEPVLVLPDLGTAPIIRWREMLRRLVNRLAVGGVPTDHYAPTLVIVTTDVDGGGERGLAWMQLVERLCTHAGLPQLQTKLLEWSQVNTLLDSVSISDGRPYARAPGADRNPLRRRRQADEMLDLIGRHPFLTVEQLAALLSVTQGRVRHLRQTLVSDGLVSVIPVAELDQVRSPSASLDGLRSLELAELSASGRRVVTRTLGLPVVVARRHQGLFGGSAHHRHRALRNLAHTVGANDVFVALSLATRAARARGVDEALEEWRPAAACERRRCKPDGYGCYRIAGTRYGFLLEYDRGTERAGQYAAKLAAYYAYRDSGQAGRDYEGFPTLLFVTTTSAAEQRILVAAKRAQVRSGGTPLLILVATTHRIAADRCGMLGPVWRQVAIGQDAYPGCGYWLSDGSPRTQMWASPRLPVN